MYIGNIEKQRRFIVDNLMLATCICRANATEKDVISCIYVKPSNKLGTLGDFEFTKQKFEFPTCRKSVG